MTTFVAGDPATRNVQRIALRVTEWTRVRPWDSTQGSPLVGLSLGEDPRVIAMAETLSRAGVVTINSLIWEGRPSLICGSKSAWQTSISAPLSARI